MKKLISILLFISLIGFFPIHIFAANTIIQPWEMSAKEKEKEFSPDKISLKEIPLSNDITFLYFSIQQCKKNKHKKKKIAMRARHKELAEHVLFIHDDIVIHFNSLGYNYQNEAITKLIDLDDKETLQKIIKLPYIEKRHSRWIKAYITENIFDQFNILNEAFKYNHENAIKHSSSFIEDHLNNLETTEDTFRFFQKAVTIEISKELQNRQFKKKIKQLLSHIDSTENLQQLQTSAIPWWKQLIEERYNNIINDKKNKKLQKKSKIVYLVLLIISAILGIPALIKILLQLTQKEKKENIFDFNLNSVLDSDTDDQTPEEQKERKKRLKLQKINNRNYNIIYRKKQYPIKSILLFVDCLEAIEIRMFEIENLPESKEKTLQLYTEGIRIRELFSKANSLFYPIHKRMTENQHIFTNQIWDLGKSVVFQTSKSINNTNLLESIAKQIHNEIENGYIKR